MLVTLSAHNSICAFHCTDTANEWRRTVEGTNHLLSTLHVFNLSISKYFLYFLSVSIASKSFLSPLLSDITFSASIGKVVTEISIFGALPNAES